MSARAKVAAAVAILAAAALLTSPSSPPVEEQTETDVSICHQSEPDSFIYEKIETSPPQTPTPTEEPSRYAGIEITEDDIETLARLAWLEARGEPFEGQVAVVEVVLNRILSPSFPDTVDEVVYQRNPLQFSPSALIPSTTPTEEQYRAVETALASVEPVTDADVVYFSTTAQNERVFAVIENHVFCRE